MGAREANEARDTGMAGLEPSWPGQGPIMACSLSIHGDSEPLRNEIARGPGTVENPVRGHK